MAITSSLHIETIKRGDCTILKKGYAQHPMKIANITEDRHAGELRLMLMSSSPGILDGDEYLVNIHVGAHTTLALETQAYQRLFSMQQGASQLANIFLDEGASFSYLPHPVVPHASSIFRSVNCIRLTSGCRLTWGEVLTSGRKLNGEQFLFNQYQNVTEIYLHNKLVIRENLVLQPAKSNVHRMGQLEEYSHQASLLFLDDYVDIKSLLPQVYEWLQRQEGICAGISATPVKGLIIRMLGNKAEQLHNILQFVATRFFLPIRELASKPSNHKILYAD